MRFRRLPALLGLALLLQSCSNRVISDEPWFRTDIAGPAFRDGIWLTDMPKCKVRETKPAETWPECATWVYRRGHQSLTPQWTESCDHGPCKRTYEDWSIDEDQLASGDISSDPMISQTRGCLPQKGEEATSGESVRVTELLDDPKAKYCYDAVRPLGRDSGGRIVSVESWPVLCGPWPKKGSEQSVTSQPWPGVTIAGDNCTVASEAILRDAAKRSYDIAKQVQLVVRAHWVRDGYR